MSSIKKIYFVILILLLCFNLWCWKEVIDNKSSNLVESNDSSKLDDSDLSLSIDDNNSGALNEISNKNSFQKLSSDYDNTITINEYIKELLSSSKKSYEFQIEKYTREGHRGELDVKYPAIIGENVDAQNINKLIYNLIDENVYKEMDDEVIDGEISYQIMKSSDDLISILFSGYMNSRTAAHPMNISFTFNYNLKDKKVINFADIIKVDEKLLSKFKGALENQLDKDIFDAIVICNENTNDLISKMNEKNYTFYLQENKIYIGFYLYIGSGSTNYISLNCN